MLLILLNREDDVKIKRRRMNVQGEMKMSFYNFLSQASSKAVTAFFSCLFSPYSASKEEPKKTPNSFLPVLRFAVCSDIHLGKENFDTNKEKFEKLFAVSYENSKSDLAYQKLDALAIAGDFTDCGSEEQYKLFKSILDDNLKDETQLICCMGNHEFINCNENKQGDEKAVERFKQYICEETDRHIIISGYHFISVSYSNGKWSLKAKAKWLKKELDKALESSPNKPIFVFQHPHAFSTVYGSVNWGDLSVKSVLKKYSQVVDFSGHSHYAPNDPRSVWQGSFTAVGTGGITGSMGNLGYISGDKYGYGDSGTFWLVEADNDGNLRLKLYDLVSDCFFLENEIYLENVSQKHKRTHTWNNMRFLDTKPMFHMNTELSVSSNENAGTVLTFDGAKGYFPAENYKINVKDEKGKTVFSKTVLSGYTRKTNIGAVCLGRLNSGKYKISITAYSPFAKKGQTIKNDFEI